MRKGKRGVDLHLPPLPRGENSKAVLVRTVAGIFFFPGGLYEGRKEVVILRYGKVVCRFGRTGFKNNFGSGLSRTFGVAYCVRLCSLVNSLGLAAWHLYMLCSLSLIYYRVLLFAILILSVLNRSGHLFDLPRLKELEMKFIFSLLSSCWPALRRSL
jgi:hypothetical protein